MTEKVEFTKKDLENLRELQARQKKWQRQEKAFYKEIDSRREEVLAHLEQTDRLETIATAYGTDSTTLFNLLMSDAQISAFKAMQEKEEATSDNIENDSFSPVANNDDDSQNSYY